MQDRYKPVSRHYTAFLLSSSEKLKLSRAGQSSAIATEFVGNNNAAKVILIFPVTFLGSLL